MVRGKMKIIDMLKYTLIGFNFNKAYIIIYLPKYVKSRKRLDRFELRVMI